MNPLTIDGSMGEGGGQILRSSLALSLVTTTPLRLVKIRANRDRPGLRRQHLTAVEAAAKVGRAAVTGASIGSRELTFEPRGVVPGEFRFAVGTAGSATLVLQTVLPALLCGERASTLWLEGGTHNPLAPPFDFVDRAFLPILRELGPDVRAELERPGFYPRGGGRFRVDVEPVSKLHAFELLERGRVRRRSARAIVSQLPASIGHRELEVVRARLGWSEAETRVDEVRDPRGPGNALLLEIESDHVTEVISAIGRRGVRAETVASEAVEEARRYLESDIPVGEHLADQLLLPLALAGAGTFRTLPPTRHTRTNADVVQRFVDVEIDMVEEPGGAWRVSVG